MLPPGRGCTRHLEWRAAATTHVAQEAIWAIHGEGCILARRTLHEVRQGEIHPLYWLLSAGDSARGERAAEKGSLSLRGIAVTS